MLFDRFRRSSSNRAPRFSFYGKLPFDREFLRYHLDSDDGRWLTAWVHGAHEVMAARREAGEDRIDTSVRAAIAAESSRTVLAAAIRPSTDGGGRSYPACAFCVLPITDLGNEWHLMPLWLDPVWHAMEIRLLAGPATNRKEFDALLDQAPRPGGHDVAATDFERAAGAPARAPWQMLTALTDEPARSAAVSFIQLARVQRAAGKGRGGIALRLPLNAGAESAGVQAAMWLRLLSVVTEHQAAWPAVVAAQPTSGSDGGSVCVFGRSPSADDLAHLLSGSGTAPIDELTDTWDPPEADADQRRLGVLLDDGATSLADLWKRMDAK